MIKTDLINIIKQQFPNCIGCLITGSQRNNITFKPIPSDIDIVIFDTYYSDIFSITIQETGFQLDYTVVPILDFDNVICNAITRDPKRILATMIYQGQILFDTDSIIFEIKQSISSLLNVKNIAAENKYEYYIRKLNRVKKYLSRQINDIQLFYLLTNLMDILTNLEMIRLTKQSGDLLKKTEAIQQQNPSFLIHIQSLFEQTIRTKNVIDIILFIDNYPKTFSDSNELKLSNCIKIDIVIPQSAIKIFINHVLPIIEKSNILNRTYCYWMASLPKYNWLSKRDISICFEPNSEISPEMIYTEFNYKLADQENGIQVCEMLPIGFALPELFTFRKRICQLNNTIVVDKIKLGITTRLCLSVIKRLRISIPDLTQLTDILLQRWVIQKKDQIDNLSVTNLVQIANYRKHLLLKEPLSFTNEDLKSSEDFFLKSNQILDDTIKQLKSNRKQDLLKYIPLQSFELFIFEDIKGVIICFVLIPELLNIMNLSDIEKCKCLQYAQNKVA